jgi:glutamate-1-semialdehyde 2,1-aminomutase
MSAIRVARAATGRDEILKFDGCYHGHGDSFLVKAGSGVATLGLPNSPGVPAALASLTLTAAFNNAEETTALMRAHAATLAAVIVEPVVGNSGLIVPQLGFLQLLRSLCDEIGAVLIFDEVMTGFRVAYGGAREAFGVTPDLTTMGKVIGGGLPVAAYGGRTELMERVAPSGPVYQAGTLSGNPLAMAGGLATLAGLSPELQLTMASRTQRLANGVAEIARDADVPCSADSVGTMWGFFFHEGPIHSFADAKQSDVALFKRFFHGALQNGVYLAPSAFEAGFMSAAHDDAIIDETLDRLRRAMQHALRG